MKPALSLMSILALSLTVFAGCADNVDNNLDLRFTSAASARSLAIGGGVILTDFQIAVELIELKADSSQGSSAADVKYTGPFYLDLLSGTSPLEQALGTVSIPAGTYKKLIFKTHKSTTAVAPGHVLYDRSMYIAGTINGTNFVFFHSPSDEIALTNTGGIQITDTEVNQVVVRFNLASITNGLALGTAVDSDADDTLEIDPAGGDNGDNQTLADGIKNNLKLLADFSKR